PSRVSLGALLRKQLLKRRFQGGHQQHHRGASIQVGSAHAGDPAAGQALNLMKQIPLPSQGGHHPLKAHLIHLRR
ncbi:MAG: hypothetical protein ACK55I_02790, partial [bacterium]